MQQVVQSALRSQASGSRGEQRPTGPRAKSEEIDWRSFPPGTVTQYSTLLCLACIFSVYTKQFGLAPRTAYTEIRRYSPTVEELTAAEPTRPFFHDESRNPRCPYCNSAKRWHARLSTHRIEGGKSTDPVRRKLMKSLPKPEEQFQVVETKSDRRTVFFEWLDRLGRTVDFTSDDWLNLAARAYLERLEPKTDWAEVFNGLQMARRSQRLEEGWEREGGRLFLAPPLYNAVLLVQYLASRSHKHGGQTYEGRLTLVELVRRLRHGGGLDAQGITERNQFDVLEKVVEQLAGGDEVLKLYYLVDRRDLLEKVKTVYARYA